ncbi:hypothetical protein JCM30237_18090 [Halolamina litorea]|uniref:HVO-0234-like beta-propeller domain-containing protein n=1 Tax=Halolamina litorea TaxID=1515593 RepID=A0ABD6BSC2_9EURY|nr:hypothetical protein [Halolamina litorea]
MPTISEKRVFDDAAAPTPVFVAAEQGLVVARLSADAVGEFSLERRCTARDLALGPEGTLVLATDEATLVASDADPSRFHETGFGPATAVGVVEGPDRAVVAADENGLLARLPLPAGAGPDPTASDWEDLATVDDVRAIDGRLVAAGDGVHRVTATGPVDAGLDDARDVAARGAPLAAVGSGLYELGNGWMLAREGVHETVATDGERANAVGEVGTVLGRQHGGGEWAELDLPTDDRIVDFAYTDEAVVAATESGSLLADAGDGWRSRMIGVTGVRAAAAGPAPTPDAE